MSSAFGTGRDAETHCTGEDGAEGVPSLLPAADFDAENWSDELEVSLERVRPYP